MGLPPSLGNRLTIKKENIFNFLFQSFWKYLQAIFAASALGFQGHSYFK